MKDSTSVGIVLIGRNEGERLRRCLHSLPQALPKIYVDSASTDNSVILARSAGAQVVELDLSIPFTAARARNAGWRFLLEQYPEIGFVQFIDGDCELDAHWLTLAESFLQTHADVAIVCGRRRELFALASIYNQLCDREWDTPIGEALACGGDALVRADVLKRLNGYDDAIVAGEEPEFCSRIRSIGNKIWRIDAPMTFHDANIKSFWQWWRRAVRGGYGYYQTWLKCRIYGRQLARSFFWAGLVPLAALIALPFNPIISFVILMLPIIQVIRRALIEGGKKIDWIEALFHMISKYAELQGIIRAILNQILSRSIAPRSYK